MLPRHVTRSTRNGRAGVNYSQKYHPMDEVMHPKRARRIADSRSLSATAKTSDEEEPEPCSGESSDQEDPSDGSESPAIRKPDSQAVRHSTRAEAQKHVNYSKSHHPQDWAILVHRRAVKRKMHDAPADKPRKKRKKQDSPKEPIVLSSDKTDGSDSDDEANDSDGYGDDTGDHGVRLSPKATSSRGKHVRNYEGYHVHSDGKDTPTPKGDRMPVLSRGEPSSNVVEAIIQGKHITQLHSVLQAANERSDADLPAHDELDNELAYKNVEDMGAMTDAIIDGVETPDGPTSGPASTYRAGLEEPALAPSATMPTALVTPCSMGTLMAPNKPCTQARTKLLIRRPYLATQLTPSTSRKPQEPNQVKPHDETSSNTLVGSTEPAANFQSNTNVQGVPVQGDATIDEDKDEEDQGVEEYAGRYARSVAFVDACQQAMRESSKHAARVARATEVTHQLSSQISSRERATPEKAGSSTTASRQISRDTLPDDPHSSYFADAIGESYGLLQRDLDDDLLNTLPEVLFGLHSSQREQSDDCAPEMLPSTDQHETDTHDA
jgi:hypothetical protein